MTRRIRTITCAVLLAGTAGAAGCGKKAPPLAPLVIREILGYVARLRQERGMTILLVEQNARAALRIADRGYVMESGLITLSGPAQDLLHDPAVRAAYLGE